MDPRNRGQPRRQVKASTKRTARGLLKVMGSTWLELALAGPGENESLLEGSSKGIWSWLTETKSPHWSPKRTCVFIEVCSTHDKNKKIPHNSRHDAWKPEWRLLKSEWAHPPTSPCSHHFHAAETWLACCTMARAILGICLFLWASFNLILYPCTACKWKSALETGLGSDSTFLARIFCRWWYNLCPNIFYSSSNLRHHQFYEQH